MRVLLRVSDAVIRAHRAVPHAPPYLSFLVGALGGCFSSDAFLEPLEGFGIIVASRPYSHHQGKLHERLMLPDLRVGYSFDAKAPISVHSQIIRTSAAAAHLGLNGHG